MNSTMVVVLHCSMLFARGVCCCCCYVFCVSSHHFFFPCLHTFFCFRRHFSLCVCAVSSDGLFLNSRAVRRGSSRGGSGEGGREGGGRRFRKPLS